MAGDMSGPKLDTNLSVDQKPRGSSQSPSPRSLYRRRISQPLAPAFITSAPGKTIVYGEHAVVHGKAAIAAAISLRSYLFVTALTKSKQTVSLRFSDIGLDHTWNIPDLPWSAFAHPNRKKKYYDLVTSLDKELVDAMQPFIQAVSPKEKPEKRKIHMTMASAFLYLYLSLGSENSPPCIYALRSAIPIGAGLGSSASVSVCISSALLIQSRALSGPHPDQQSEEAEKQLERINRWAFVCELLIHGNPSGVDNTVATNGHAVRFQRTDYSKPPSVLILRDFPELPLLLIDTCQPKSTAVEVAKVGKLKSTHPVVVDAILDTIDTITNSVYDMIVDEDFDPTSHESIARLGELMSVNHGLLTSLGVSHPRLERVRYLVDQAGVGWTKLTGAGGGGCAITLLKPESTSLEPPATAALNGHKKSANGHHSPILQHNGISPSIPHHGPKPNGHNFPAPLFANGNGEAAFESSPPRAALLELEHQLAEEGFIKYETSLGGDGVGVLYPAIINEEEIDLEMFLTAEGREGIEELVGGRHDRDAWKYWRP